MDVRRILAQLRAERRRIDKAVAALQEITLLGSAQGRERKRKRRSARIEDGARKKKVVKKLAPIIPLRPLVSQSTPETHPVKQPHTVN